jgi:hypothetical protein
VAFAGDGNHTSPAAAVDLSLNRCVCVCVCKRNKMTPSNNSVKDDKVMKILNGLLEMICDPYFFKNSNQNHYIHIISFTLLLAQRGLKFI